jgi:hypothetical protein
MRELSKGHAFRQEAELRVRGRDVKVGDHLCTAGEEMAAVDAIAATENWITLLLDGPGGPGSRRLLMHPDAWASVRRRV